MKTSPFSKLKQRTRCGNKFGQGVEPCPAMHKTMCSFSSNRKELREGITVCPYHWCMIQAAGITQTQVNESSFKLPVLPLAIQYRLINIVLHENTVYPRKRFTSVSPRVMCFLYFLSWA